MGSPVSARSRWAAPLAVLAALAVALAQPAAPASAQARPIDNACPDDGRVPDSGFTDLGPTHAEAIECIAASGVAAGRTSTTFVPLGTVTRGQMATFLVRGLDVAGVDLPDPAPEDTFSDVGDSVHETPIRLLAAVDPPVVAGFGDGSFRPSDPVTRGQTATLVANAHAIIGEPDLPSPDDTDLTDVEGTTHEQAIVALEEAGIVTGFGDNTYRPRADIQRGQMASVLARHLDLLVDAGVSGGLAAGEWVVLPDAPIAPDRFNHTATWADDRLRIWGGVEDDVGLDDGAVYDPATGGWAVIPEAPIPGRFNHVATWTGEQLLVWGGIGGLGDRHCHADGAAYDPVQGSWDVLADSPLEGRCPAEAWTGDEWVLWGGDPADQIPPTPFGDGAAYGPWADDWRMLPDAPIARTGADGAWTGDEVLFFGGNDADGRPLPNGAAYDPAGDDWRMIAEAPIAPRFTPAVTWMDGELLVVAGGDPDLPEDVDDVGAMLQAASDGARYDPAADAWEPLARGVPGWHQTPEIAWGDGLAYVVGGATTTPGPAAAAYDPVADNWSVLPQPPGGGRINHTATWGDGRLYVYGYSDAAVDDAPGAVVWDPF